MGNFNNAYYFMKIYSNLEQSNSENNKATKTSENLEESAQAGGTLGNLEKK